MTKADYTSFRKKGKGNRCSPLSGPHAIAQAACLSLQRGWKILIFPQIGYWLFQPTKTTVLSCLLVKNIYFQIMNVFDAYWRKLGEIQKNKIKNHLAILHSLLLKFALPFVNSKLHHKHFLLKTPCKQFSVPLIFLCAQLFSITYF